MHCGMGGLSTSQCSYLVVSLSTTGSQSQLGFSDLVALIPGPGATAGASLVWPPLRIVAVFCFGAILGSVKAF